MYFASTVLGWQPSEFYKTAPQTVYGQMNKHVEHNQDPKKKKPTREKVLEKRFRVLESKAASNGYRRTVTH